MTWKGDAADALAAMAVRLGSPLFRRVAANSGRFPRYLRQADRSGIHLRTTHYYQPTYADADLPADVTGERALPGLDLNVAAQLQLLQQFAFGDELERIAASSADHFGFDHANGMYAYGDAESLYTMLRWLKPRRIIEIGSGNSTRIARAAIRTNERDGAPPCDHTCIEPYEMPWLEQLGVTVLRERVQDVDMAQFQTLKAGDVLFIDSSHVIRPYGDVLIEYQQIIPTLRPGVLVHVHDIFTPRDYPEAWLRAERRLWNEQYLLEVMLAHSDRYRIRLAMNYLKHHYFDAVARALPVTGRHPGEEPGAFWFEVAA